MQQTQKIYTNMTADEQSQWVGTFADILETHGQRITALAKTKGIPSAAMASQPSPAEQKAIRTLFSLLAAWPFAQDFCAKAERYGDYMLRVSRLPVYIEKVKERLADGLTMTDSRGRVVAYVSPSAPARRRGRPTKEEAAARLAGRHVTIPTDSPENATRRRIAALLGLEVIVAGEPPREKNNAELALDRQRKQAEYDRQNPSLFPAGTAAESPVITTSRNNDITTAAPPVPAASTAGPSTPAPSMLMSDVYADRIAQDRFHLTDLAWLCSDDLKPRIEAVRAQRTASEAASERAKLLAEQGAAPEVIAPYAQQAQEAIEAYTATYAAVDEQLAILFKRLEIDVPFTDRFKARFKGVNVEKVMKITRPYYEKMKCDELDLRIRTLIEQDNPEYAARLEQEAKDKAEVSDIVRYITRKDKDASDSRVKTMTARIARLRELRGDEFADAYLPILEKTKEENVAWRAAKAAKKKTASGGSPAGKKSTPKKKQQ